MSIDDYIPNVIFLPWFSYLTGIMCKENNLRGKSMHALRRHEITSVVSNCQSSGLHVHFLYGFISLQSSVWFYFQHYKRWHCPANQLSRFSCTKLSSSYSRSDLLLHLTKKSRESALWVKHLLHLPFPLSDLGTLLVLCGWSGEYSLWAAAQPNEKFHSCFLWEHSWFCVVPASLAVWL